MWPMTARQWASLAKSTDRTARVDVLRDGQPVPGGRIDATHPTLRLLAGSVQVDRATIRRSGTVSILDTTGTLVPDSADDLFAPLIGELRLWVGIRYWDWTYAESLTGDDWFWIPVGTLVVIGVAETGPFTYDVTLLDRLQFLTAFAANYSIVAATPTMQALADLLATFVPVSHLQLNLPTSEFVTGDLLYEEGGAVGDVAHDLALSAGFTLYADPMGVITAAPEPSTDDDPVWTLQSGAGSVLMQPTQDVTATDAVNAVAYTGEAPDLPPVRGYAEDTDPLSLTYRPRVGYRPAPTQSSPLLRTPQQADLAAKTWLRRNLGLSGTPVVPVIPNPALESGDVIRVVTEGRDVTLIADTFDVPLFTSGEQKIQCRAQVIR